MIFTITAKELRSMFTSPLAWVVLAIVQLILAFLFLNRVDYFITLQAEIARAPNVQGLTGTAIVPMFGIASIVLLMSVPLLTMRMVSEERRNQTMALLMAAPISMSEIILGKYLALIAFLGLINLLIVSMALSLLAGGTIDFGLLMANLIGLMLLGASFAAIGLYISCLTTHPVVAAILSLGAFLGLWIMNIAASDPESVLNVISLLKHFEGFLNGAIAAVDLIYFCLLISTFLILSIRRLDADRLRA